MADAREMFYPVEIQRDYQGMMRISGMMGTNASILIAICAKLSV